MRPPKVQSVEQCKTVFQYALVNLKKELGGVTTAELAQSMGVNQINLSQWINLTSFPRDEDEFYRIVKEYPSLRVVGGGYDKFRSDYKEYKGNSNWPTKTLTQIFKEKGYTYYKSKGRFEKGTTDFEEHKKERDKQTFFKTFKDAVSSEPTGRKLMEMLFSLTGEIPETEDLDLNCITDERVYEETMKRLDDKATEAQKICSKLTESMFVLKKLHLEYDKLKTIGTPTESRMREEEELWKRNKSIIKGV